MNETSECISDRVDRKRSLLWIPFTYQPMSPDAISKPSSSHVNGSHGDLILSRNLYPADHCVLSWPSHKSHMTPVTQSRGACSGLVIQLHGFLLQIRLSSNIIQDDNPSGDGGGCVLREVGGLPFIFSHLVCVYLCECVCVCLSLCVSVCTVWSAGVWTPGFDPEEQSSFKHPFFHLLEAHDVWLLPQFNQQFFTLIHVDLLKLLLNRVELYSTLAFHFVLQLLLILRLTERNATGQILHLLTSIISQLFPWKFPILHYL